MRLRIIAAALIAISAADSHATEYLWRNVSLDGGLSHSNVTAITRDNNGFVWIGTRFGLNRYDFEKVTNYYNSQDDKATIPDNSITSLLSDSHGNIWVAGEQGVAVNRDGRTFERITLDGKQLSARSFIEEPYGLLMGSKGVIYYYDYNSGAVAPLQTRGGSTHYYTDIINRGNNFYILVTRWDGLWLFDRKSATISRMPGIEDKNIMAAYIDSLGTLWVSPYGKGVTAYDRAGKPIYNFTTANSALPNNIILAITEHDHNIWFGTDGGGVAIFNPDTESLEANASQNSRGQNASVTTLFTDKSNNLYAGTVRDGMASVTPVAMHTFHNSHHPMSTITSAWPEDNKPVIWLGDDGKGVIRYDLDNETLTPVGPTAGIKVTDIVEHDKTHLLVSTFDKGFFLMDKASGRLTPAPPALESLRQGIGNPAMSILIKKLSDNMIAVVSDRISIYDPTTGKIIRESMQPQGLTGSLKPFFNGDGRLLCYGTNYVTEYDPVTDAHRCLFRLTDNERINCAVFDGSHTIFAVTDGGMTIFDTTTGEISTHHDVNKRISALAFDNNGRLYVATTRMLYIKNRDTGNIVGFGVNDGVMPNEYLPNSTLLHNNCLLFGGVYGLLRIHTDEVDALLADQTEPSVNIAEINIDGIDCSSSVKDGVLTVPDDHGAVTLSVIDNGSNSQRRQYFRYIITGGGGAKTIETFARTIDLNFLEEGNEYDISVSSMRPDGSWTTPEPIVSLSVTTPWWKSPLVAFILIIILSGLIFALWIRNYHRHKDRDNARMDIYRRNTLEKELSFFVNTNYALRTPLTLIYAPVKLLIEQLQAGEKVDLLPSLEMIYRNTKKMRDSIDMALQLHQVTDQHDESQLSTHDINRSVTDVIAILRHDSEVKHITLRHLRSQEVLAAPYDRNRLRAVIETIIHNAIQRSSDHATIEIRTSQHDNFIRVAVSDSGEHLDTDTLEGLFSRYFHDDNSKFGNSLGFAYVRNIIDMMDGRTGVENNADGPGITVWFEFPAAPSQDVEKYISRRQSEVEVPTGDPGETVVSEVDTSTLTAIVVEADNDLGVFIAQQLSHYFGRVLHAFNGKEALVLIRQYQPDIVISSLMLPVLSGIDLCRTLKKSPETSHIPVILLTSIKEGPQLASAYGAGADSYLSKPFDLQVLLTRCRNILYTHSVMKRRYSVAAAPKADNKMLSNADESFMLKIDKIINDNLSNPKFSVDVIVEKTAYSRSALYARFKEITGQSIGVYIADYRLRRAKELLQSSDMSINEISEALGFSSQRYFSTFFKERTGMSPSAFRQSSKTTDNND